VQKQLQQKSSPQEVIYIASVPVKVTISSGKTTIQEYEDVIDIEFNDKTEEGRINIAYTLALKKEQGLSSDEAIFLIASKVHEDYAKQFAATLSVSPPVELQVKILGNGEITYVKNV
jgi:hypothetical protein